VDGKVVKVRMTDPHGLRTEVPLALRSGKVRVGFVNTGVPHVVMAVADLEAVDVPGLGREIRHHEDFAPAGTNVNFIRPEAYGGIAIRTYERGVEGETLACGTGAVAGALVAAGTLKLPSPVAVRTRGGEVLTVYFRQTEAGFRDIYQQGGARLIYTGTLSEEAWR
jgi:diaminopimelate epimerase